MSPNNETLIPTLLSEYLDSRRVQLGLPAAEILPFVIAPTTVEQLFPRVVFVAADVNFPHPKRMTLSITVELQVGAETQEIPEENVWTTAVRHGVSDKAAFRAWLAALPEEKRTGYEVRKMWVVDGGMAVDDGNKTRGRRTSVNIHLRTDELA